MSYNHLNRKLIKDKDSGRELMIDLSDNSIIYSGFIDVNENPFVDTGREVVKAKKESCLPMVVLDNAHVIGVKLSREMYLLLNNQCSEKVEEDKLICTFPSLAFDFMHAYEHYRRNQIKDIHFFMETWLINHTEVVSLSFSVKGKGKAIFDMVVNEMNSKDYFNSYFDKMAKKHSYRLVFNSIPIAEMIDNDINRLRVVVPVELVELSSDEKHYHSSSEIDDYLGNL